MNAGPVPTVFILGCGRSGTSVFGDALSRHPQLTYLNERRDLWAQACPTCDIWSSAAAAGRHGKLVLSRSDAGGGRADRLRDLFRRELRRGGGTLLVEKLPINSFRTGFIDAAFPDARYLHLYRNGLEVAHSIAGRVANGRWFGHDDYKWQQLVAHSLTGPQTAGLPALCKDDYSRGLLEWRLSTESTVRFLRGLENHRYHEVSYADLTREPDSTLARTLDFLRMPAEAAVTAFVRRQLARRSPNLDASPLNQREARLGGPLLPLSMGGSPGSGLTRRPSENG